MAQPKQGFVRIKSHLKPIDEAHFMPLNEAKKGPFWPHLISFNSILLAHAQTIPFFQRVFGAIHKDVLIYFRIHLIIRIYFFKI